MEAKLETRLQHYMNTLSLSESARTMLYTLSKQFKDVANDEFPLSAELDEEMKARLEAAKIPIDTDAGVEKLVKIKLRVAENLHKEWEDTNKIYKERMKREKEAQKEKEYSNLKINNI